jgi:hypothetical protein
VIGYPVTEKLSRNKFHQWKAQVMSALRGAKLAGFIDSSSAAPMATVVDKEGKETPNPEYADWVVQDQ